MKIKMLEHFQGTGQPTLKFGKEYDSLEIGKSLCEWLLEHRKAEDVTPEPVEIEPEEAQEEQAQPEKPAKRARSTRGRAKVDEGN